MSSRTFIFVCLFSQMKSPGVTTSDNGKNRTLYMQTVKSIEERTKQNLKKTLKGEVLHEISPYFGGIFNF